MIRRSDDSSEREDDALEAEFPLGDGTADTSAVVHCPWCAEVSEIGVDPGSGVAQEYVEDCPVCCRPWQVHVRYRGDGSVDVRIDRAEDDG